MRKNIIFVCCIVLAAVLLALLLGTNRADGALVHVSIADNEGFTLPLGTDKAYEYGTETGAQLPFTLEVSEGRVRFVNSQCPDHVCEGFGWLAKERDEAVCLPAGVVVRVEAQQ